MVENRLSSVDLNHLFFLDLHTTKVKTSPRTITTANHRHRALSPPRSITTANHRRCTPSPPQTTVTTSPFRSPPITALYPPLLSEFNDSRSYASWTETSHSSDYTTFEPSGGSGLIKSVLCLCRFQLLFTIHTFPLFSQPLPPRSSSPVVAPHAAVVRFSLRFVCFVSSLTAGRTPPTHPYCCSASHRHRRRPAIVAPHAATIAIHSAVVRLSLSFVCL
ncbi:hypothetical protein RIF29_24740 [Crotalaria pallida]|uniref:Uncharacterized protein n=1 Tax=Crotalaria pallida TaxID=3830 RepID=A0AAN9EMS5_CROPI